MPAKRCVETKNMCLLFVDYCKVLQGQRKKYRAETWFDSERRKVLQGQRKKCRSETWFDSEIGKVLQGQRKKCRPEIQYDSV